MAKIEDNPFYQTMKSDKLTIVGKTKAIEEMLASPGADTLKEFKEYKKFLDDERQRMSADILRMTDAKVFGDLKSTIDEMNKGILDFDKNMGPLTDIAQSIQGLRTGSQAPAVGQPAVAESPAAPPELVFDGVLDHSVSVRRTPISLKTRYYAMRV